MTSDDLIKLGNNKPVQYRGERVTFECLSMAFKPWSGRKQPMQATIKLPSGRVVRVSPAQLSPETP